MTIENTPQERIEAIIASQKEFFKTGATLDVEFRKEQLHKLASALQEFEKPLADALWTDLHKSFQEAYLTEIGLVKAEIREHLKGVSRWARRKRVRTPLTLFPSSSFVVKEPLVCTDSITMELPGSVASQPACRRNIGRMYRNTKAIALRARRIGRT